MFRSSDKRRGASASRGERERLVKHDDRSFADDRAGKTRDATRDADARAGDEGDGRDRRGPRVLNARDDGYDAHASTSYAHDVYDDRMVDERYVPGRYVARYHASPAMEVMMDDEGGRRGRPHRDQFLTSAMLCVGAVSVCLVSVMIAGGLAFVGLSESHERGGGMEYVRSGADAWTSAGGYRSGDVEQGERLFASRGGRYDYFAQPDRLNQDALVDELDKRYGARLEALMHAMQSGESGGFTLASMHRGDDPSYLPPAPMTEMERKLNAAAEIERRNASQHLPVVVDDDDGDDDDDDDGADELERRAYDKASTPHDVVKKARERFEEYENTVEWHEKIREDADNYIERLSEIQAILSHGYHKSARKQIELGVEAVRQWHSTIAKDLKTKTGALEIALEQIANAKESDDSVHVSALQRDIEDELEALKTSSGRVRDLKHVVRKIVDVLSSKHGADQDSGKGVHDDDDDSSRHHHDHATKEALDLDPEMHDHERAMKHWKNVADEWVDPKTHVSRKAEALAPWTQARAALGAAAPTPTPTLNAALQKLIALARNITDDVGQKVKEQIKDVLNDATDVLTATMNLTVNLTNATSIDDIFNVTIRMAMDNSTSTSNATQAEKPNVGSAPHQRLLPALGLPAPVKKTLAKLGGSWGPNQWVGTDAEDATWDPIYGADSEDDVQAAVMPERSVIESQPLTSTRNGAHEDDGATKEEVASHADVLNQATRDEEAAAKRYNYKYTPTPDEEDFKSTADRDAAEDFAKAEHKSAEAWRAEAIKAQEKLAELASKGFTHSKKDVEDEETSEETVKEFKKALVREADARAKAEKELRELKIRAANEQEETEKRVVEQAKLQILAARAEARDASLARIKAEAEAEKIAKEKSKLAKAAAKVQESAEKALESLVQPGASRPTVEAAPKAVPAPPKVTIEATDSPATTTWDSAENEVKHASTSKTSTSKSSTSKSSTSTREFTLTFGVKDTDALKKADVETLRDAALSLLDARAPGACDDTDVSTHTRSTYSGAFEVDVTCDDVPNARLRASARDAARWAFENDRFTRNLRTLGFTHSDKVYLARVSNDDDDDDR